MPNGSCCPEANFCQVGNDKYCCSEGQTCDTTSGCVDAKDNIETLCANAGGTIINASSGTFCKSNDDYMTWYQAEEWCLNKGMTMPTMYEMCPSWDGNVLSKCPELSGKGDDGVWSATINYGLPQYVHLWNGDTNFVDWNGYSRAFCR